MASGEIDRLSKTETSKNSNAFELAISRGVRFWRRYSSGAADGKAQRVVVDLLVDHPVYYLGNLILAKYLELAKGLKPWALVSSTNDRKIILLARSFGIEQFTFVRDEAAKDARPEAAHILAKLEGQSGKELRRRVLAIKINDLPVGDLLYDTYLRETRQVTLQAVDDDLRAYTALAINYYALYDRLLADQDVAAVVMGHLVYLRFGLIARLAAARGADIFARYGGKGMRLQRRRGLADACDVMTRVEPALVDNILANEGEEAVRIGEATLTLRMGGQGNEFEYLNEEGYSPARRRMPAPELAKSMGLNPDRPKALLMLHAFPDANHFSPGLLFDDFYDWYRQTLEIAFDLPHIDWLVKLHPNLVHYTDDKAPAALMIEATTRHGHIHAVPEGVHTASLAGLSGFLITVNGKAGLEFAACSVPVILGGRGFFAGNGFSEEPQDISEYVSMLVRGPDLTLDADQRRRALVANDLFYRRLIVDCRFLPDSPYSFWQPFDEGAFWRGYTEAMESGGIEDDDLYRAMMIMFENDTNTLLRPRL